MIKARESTRPYERSAYLTDRFLDLPDLELSPLFEQRPHALDEASYGLDANPKQLDRRRQPDWFALRIPARGLKGSTSYTERLAKSIAACRLQPAREPSSSSWQRMQLVAHGRACSRFAAIGSPQFSQMP